MRASLAALLLVGLLACGSKDSSGPTKHDPVAIVRNDQTRDPVIWWWEDGHNASGIDTIPAGVTRCERFFARPDSARFSFADSVRIKANGGGWYDYTSNWFDPTARPSWSVTISDAAALVKDTADVPC